MLILSRETDEKILIGEDIEIMVVDVHHGKVRLGIACPPEVRVVREELVCSHTWKIIRQHGDDYVKKCSGCGRIEDRDGMKITPFQWRRIKRERRRASEGSG